MNKNTTMLQLFQEFDTATEHLEELYAAMKTVKRSDEATLETESWQAVDDQYVLGETYIVKSSGAYAVTAAGNGKVSWVVKDATYSQEVSKGEIEDNGTSDRFYLSVGDQVIVHVSADAGKTETFTINQIATLYDAVESDIEEAIRNYQQLNARIDNLLYILDEGVNERVDERLSKISDTEYSEHFKEIAREKLDEKVTAEEVTNLIKADVDKKVTASEVTSKITADVDKKVTDEKVTSSIDKKVGEKVNETAGTIISEKVDELVTPESVNTKVDEKISTVLSESELEKIHNISGMSKTKLSLAASGWAKYGEFYRYTTTVIATKKDFNFVVDLDCSACNTVDEVDTLESAFSNIFRVAVDWDNATVNSGNYYRVNVYIYSTEAPSVDMNLWLNH